MASMERTEALETDHVLLFAYSFYGHQKPMCDLAVKIIRSRPVCVSLLVGDTLFDAIQKQVANQIDPEKEKHFLPLIRVVGIDCGESGFDSVSTNKAFYSAFKALVAREQVSKRPGSRASYNAIPPPRLVILDLFGYEALQTVSSLGGSSIKVLVLQPSMAAQVFLMSGPKELGGRGDFAAELERAAKTVNLECKMIAKSAQQL